MRDILCSCVYIYIIYSQSKESPLKMITDFGSEINFNQYNLNLLNYLKKLFTLRDCVVID